MTSRILDRRRLLIGAATMPAMPAIAQAAIQPRAVGAVAAMRGSVFAERGPDNVSLREASPVLLQDLVRTGPESRCALKLGTATTIQMGENVKLRLDRYLVRAGGVLSLDAGAVIVTRDEQSRTHRLLLNSPYALIAIRGTSYFAGLLPDGFGVFVQRGVVSVSAARSTVTLHAGQGTRIRTIGARPEPPVAWGDAKIALARHLVM